MLQQRWTRLRSRAAGRRVAAVCGTLLAAFLFLGPSARPLAAWAGLPISATTCGCPPARCHCPHGTAPRAEAAGTGTVEAARTTAGDDCGTRPSCPRRAGSAQHDGSSTRTASAGAAHPPTHHGSLAAAAHTAGHPGRPAGTVPAGHSHAAPAAADAPRGDCSMTSRCGDESSPVAGTMTWLQAAAGPAGWAAPVGPGDLSPPAANARLLDSGHPPELPPPRRIAPIA
jgi:hypothetical protein